MSKKIKKMSIVGKIIKIKRHPNADRLYIATVNVGQQKLITIIFGGNYVLKPDELVAVALPGTRLSNGDKIRPKNYRGIKSYGEILSSDELNGTSGGPDETLVLSPKDFSVGDLAK